MKFLFLLTKCVSELYTLFLLIWDLKVSRATACLQLFFFFFTYITLSPMPHETCESTSLFLKMKMRPMGFLAKMHPDNLYSFKHSVWDLTRECVCECECLHIYLCMLSVCYSGGWQVWGVAGDAKINLFKILIAFQKKKRKLRQRMNHMLFDFNDLKAVMLRCQQL